MGDGVLIDSGYPRSPRGRRRARGPMAALGRRRRRRRRLQPSNRAPKLASARRHCHRPRGGRRPGRRADRSAGAIGVVGETPEPRRPVADPLAEPGARSDHRPPARAALVGDLSEYRAPRRGRGQGPSPSRRQVLAGAATERCREPLRGPAPGSALDRLVGRDQEIDLLLRRWARAEQGHQLPLVSGDPASVESQRSPPHWKSSSKRGGVRTTCSCSPLSPGRRFSPSSTSSAARQSSRGPGLLTAP